MKIGRSGDLMFRTYYMVDWSKTVQTPSETKCVQCGGAMNEVEPVTDDSGKSYSGLVCHACKRVLWFKDS